MRRFAPIWASVSVGRMILMGAGVALLLGAWGASVSCGRIPKVRTDLVTRLRVLGIKSEPLEAPPGTTVTLTALVVDPKGNGRPIMYLWGVCPANKGGGTGCTGPNDLVLLGVGPTVSYTLSGPAPAMPVVGLMVTAGTEYELSFKRMFVSESSAPNHNPSIQALYVSGTAVTGAASTSTVGTYTTLTVLAAPGSVEGGRSIPEHAFVSWFITAGELQDPLTVGETSGNLWTFNGENGTPVTGTTLYAILRDGAGGIDWTETTLVVH